MSNFSVSTDFTKWFNVSKYTKTPLRLAVFIAGTKSTNINPSRTFLFPKRHYFQNRIHSLKPQLLWYCKFLANQSSISATKLYEYYILLLAIDFIFFSIHKNSVFLQNKFIS